MCEKTIPGAVQMFIINWKRFVNMKMKVENQIFQEFRGGIISKENTNGIMNIFKNLKKTNYLKNNLNSTLLICFHKLE